MTTKNKMTAKDAGKTSVGTIIAIVLVVGLVCVGALTIDSCKRLNRQCFGTSWSK